MPPYWEDPKPNNRNKLPKWLTLLAKFAGQEWNALTEYEKSTWESGPFTKQDAYAWDHTGPYNFISRVMWDHTSGIIRSQLPWIPGQNPFGEIGGYTFTKSAGQIKIDVNWTKFWGGTPHGWCSKLYRWKTTETENHTRLIAIEKWDDAHVYDLSRSGGYGSFCHGATMYDNDPQPGTWKYRITTSYKTCLTDFSTASQSVTYP